MPRPVSLRDGPVASRVASHRENQQVSRVLTHRGSLPISPLRSQPVHLQGNQAVDLRTSLPLDQQASQVASRRIHPAHNPRRGRPCSPLLNQPVVRRHCRPQYRVANQPVSPRQVQLLSRPRCHRHLRAHGPHLRPLECLADAQVHSRVACRPHSRQHGPLGTQVLIQVASPAHSLSAGQVCSPRCSPLLGHPASPVLVLPVCLHTNRARFQPVCSQGCPPRTLLVRQVHSPVGVLAPNPVPRRSENRMLAPAHSHRMWQVSSPARRLQYIYHPRQAHNPPAFHHRCRRSSRALCIVLNPVLFRLQARLWNPWVSGWQLLANQHCYQDCTMQVVCCGLAVTAQ